jgi:hypothetical protein
MHLSRIAGLCLVFEILYEFRSNANIFDIPEVLLAKQSASTATATFRLTAETTLRWSAPAAISSAYSPPAIIRIILSTADLRFVNTARLFLCYPRMLFL